MALLNINWQGVDFERGLDVLRDSLVAATGALEANRIAIQQAWDEYEDAVANGAPPDEVWEDELKVWDQTFAYENDIQMIDETLDMMRKAHVIALYHLWERIVRSWTRAPQGDRHDDLVRRVEAKGIAVDFRLTAVRDLNNALKHNSEIYGPRLLTSWPEVFTDKFRSRIEDRLAKLRIDPTAAPIDWHDAITVTEDRMDEILEAVRMSGPVGGAAPGT